MESRAYQWIKQASQVCTILFMRGLKTTLIFQTGLLILLHAFLYISSGSEATRKVFLGFGLDGFVFFALNVAFIYTITFIVFRGLISPLIFWISAVIYAAIVKYATGALFLGLDIEDFGAILPIGLYLYFMTYLDGLIHSEIETAVTYRTTSDDD